ncbi:nucleotide exchange factor GrpE [Streptomyces mexicanus]|jgi:molecular chaperone GrpE|uniref:Protein GrpE n=1 Tax=Streptomyces mexicanus TaxID=178566 RepID=A0A7X1I562_9ACTN|nr:nucleotide exchange factor GrpE [Streptomyces mexicanus]MBC2868581.1 nucleotide exchange factor GrpE [Streptomyces mexicanus]
MKEARNLSPDEGGRPTGSAAEQESAVAAEKARSAAVENEEAEAATAQTQAATAAEEGPRPIGEPAGGGESAAELRDRWLRAMAELDNQRKRYERTVADVRAAERERVLSLWLPVLDHLELALRHAEADPKSIIAGVEAVQRQALATMEGLGYHRFAEVGEKFDPSLHEAAQARDVPSAEAGTIVEVLKAGYRSDRQLLRPAVVAVAKRPE